MIFLFIFCYTIIILLAYYLRTHDKPFKPIKVNVEDIGKYCIADEKDLKLTIPLSTDNEGVISFHYATDSKRIYDEISKLDDGIKPVIKNITLSILPWNDKSNCIQPVINSSLKFIDNLRYIEKIRKTINNQFFSDGKFKILYVFTWTFNLKITEDWEPKMNQDILRFFQLLPRRKGDYLNVFSWFKKCIIHGINFREKHYLTIISKNIDDDQESIKFIEDFISLYQELSTYYKMYNDFVEKLNFREKKKYKEYQKELKWPNIELKFKWITDFRQ